MEIEQPRHREQIVNVLHAAVRKVARDHGFKFLSCHGFAKIRVECRCRLIQKYGIFKFHWGRSYRIPETDIDLNRDDGGAKFSRGAGPKNSMGPIIAERFREDIIGIGGQIIVCDRQGADFANRFDQRSCLPVRKGEKIKITSHSERVSDPCSVEHLLPSVQITPYGARRLVGRGIVPGRIG